MSASLFRLIHCGDVVAMSDLFVDGELPATRRLEVQSHLETCGLCASVVVQKSALKRRLRGCVLSMEVPVWLHQNLRRLISCEREDERWQN